MEGPLRVSAGELGEDAILDALQQGRRVLITTEMLGEEHQVALRYDGSIYYCDTPTRLHRHEDEDEMRTCVRNMGYATGGGADSAD